MDEVVKQAQSLDAMVVRPKSPVPRMGWFAVLVDPEMNPFTIWQHDPNAG